MRILAVSLIAVFTLASQAWAGPIYVYKDKGAIRFTSRPPPGGVQAQVWTAKAANFSVFRVAPHRAIGGKLYKNVYNEFISSACESHSLATSLVKAVIHAESAFNPRAVSRAGARGLMQLMPGTAQLMGIKNSFDPKQNIHAGTRYLAFLLQRYDGNLNLALAAYNAGPGAVDQYNGIPPYAETKEYVRRVLELKKRYDRGA